MFCTKCGLCLPDVARFCTRCGTPVMPRPQAPVYQQSAPVSQPAYYPPQNAPVYPPRPVYQQPVQQPIYQQPVHPQTPMYPQTPVYQQPVSPVAPVAPAPAPMPAPAPAPMPEPIPEPAPAPMPEPIPEPAPAPMPEPVPEPAPAPMPEPIPMPVPPYIPPAPPAPKKKSGGKIAVILIVSILVVALTGVAVWGFADGWLPELFTSQTGGGDADGGEAENGGGSANGPGTPDGMAVECDGLTIRVGKDYKESYRSATSVTYDNFYVVIYMDSYETASMGENIVDSASLARSYAKGLDRSFDSVEIKSANGVSYVTAKDDDADNADLYGCYVDGDKCWVVRASVYDLDRYEDEAISIITSGKTR